MGRRAFPELSKSRGAHAGELARWKSVRRVPLHHRPRELHRNTPECAEAMGLQPRSIASVVFVSA
jgi:hypothetical protein